MPQSCMGHLVVTDVFATLQSSLMPTASVLLLVTISSACAIMRACQDAAGSPANTTVCWHQHCLHYSRRPIHSFDVLHKQLSCSPSTLVCAWRSSTISLLCRNMAVVQDSCDPWLTFLQLHTLGKSADMVQHLPCSACKAAQWDLPGAVLCCADSPCPILHDFTQPVR
jgi:hypothetical protein